MTRRVLEDADRPLEQVHHGYLLLFVTYAHLRGATDRAIAHQTRHRSLTLVGTYIRVHTAWEDNSVTQLGVQETPQ